MTNGLVTLNSVHREPPPFVQSSLDIVARPNVNASKDGGLVSVEPGVLLVSVWMHSIALDPGSGRCLPTAPKDLMTPGHSLNLLAPVREARPNLCFDSNFLRRKPGIGCDLLRCRQRTQVPLFGWC